MEALRQARKLMGYYHLKTSEDFVVPEEQRMTTQRKRRQLLLLRKQVRGGGLIRVGLSVLECVCLWCRSLSARVSSTRDCFT